MFDEYVPVVCLSEPSFRLENQKVPLLPLVPPLSSGAAPPHNPHPGWSFLKVPMVGQCAKWVLLWAHLQFAKVLSPLYFVLVSYNLQLAKRQNN